MKKLGTIVLLGCLLILFGLQMVSAQDGEYAYPVGGDYAYPVGEYAYPVGGDYAYPVEPRPTAVPLSCDPADFTLSWNPDVMGFCDTCPKYCAKQDKPSLPPPAKEVVENTPAINQNIVNRIMTTSQLLRKNRIRRPIVIPSRNMLDNLFRFLLVK